MKNLELFDYKDTVLAPLPTESESNTLKPLVLDNGDLFFYDENHLYHYESNQLVSWYDTSFEIVQIFPDELLNVFYIISNLHIRSISYEGQTSCYDTDMFTLYDWNGEADDEIITAALSPDKEHIVVLTKSAFAITLLSNFKLLSQHDLISSTVKGEKESVNVGWGKVETQFKGSAKASAQPAGTVFVDEGPPSVVWRNDSELYAVSFFNPELGARQIKVFKVYGGDCSLQYTSKALPGLESHLSWRPHVMNHLVTTQRLPNKYVLAFIEKNTELKDSVSLDSVSYVKCLKWNTDGTILAVMREDNRVLLYTCSNCHWYLKQDLHFSRPVHLQWTTPTQCSILSYPVLRTYTWTTRVIANCGVVAVVDACEVLVTDLNQSVIPPPMCGVRLKTPEPSDNINRVLPLPHSPQDLLLITSSGNLYSFKSGEWEKIIPLSTEGENTEANPLEREIFNKACVWSEKFLVFVRRKRELCALDLEGDHRVSTLCMTPHSIVSITRKSSHELILQLDSRELIVYTNSNEELTKSSEVETKSPEVAFVLPELCTNLEYASGHLCALSSTHKLYDNGSLALNDVSSFSVYNDWLLVTTLTHKLQLFRLLPELAIDESAGISRRLERGGTLVSVTRAASVALQMPRGNLETVTPRPLALDLISCLLNEKNYAAAFVQMRKHRIDLNLLIDYARPDYDRLVSQVNNASWLSNLIADLKPEDVTKQDAFYAEYYAKCSKNRDPDSHSSQVEVKDVASICSRLRSALQAKDPVKYAHVIMHCAVKGEAWDETFAIARQSSEALEFLILLHDVNSLYERALRAYDLQLAFQIAGKSQKDPKEYVPYLNQLRSLPINRMKADIDKQFGNYLGAVRHLAANIMSRTCDKGVDQVNGKSTADKIGTADDIVGASKDKEQVTDGSTDEEECLDLIRKHKLWSQTLDVFPRGSDSYLSIVKEYGLQLELKGRGAEEAGLMYERGGAHEEAMRCFVRAGAWRSALLAARKLNLSSDQLNSLYGELTRYLSSRDDVMSLVSLLEYRHKNDVISSSNVINGEVVSQLLPVNAWLAIDLAKQYGLDPLIDSDIKPSLIDLTAELTDEISNHETAFHMHLARLRWVRDNPRPLGGMGGPGGAGDEELSDWGSETGSTLSTRSGHTGTSTSSRGRRKRKQDRKLWSLKEGNPREEISLVKTLAETIQALENCSGRVKQLCLALVRLEMDALALNLQNKLRDTLATLDKKKADIWPLPEEEEVSVDDKRVNLPPLSSIQHHWELECLKRK